MNKCWIVVAHRAGARIFLRRGHAPALELVEAIEHPRGRLQERDLGSDRPGRAYNSVGQSRHAMSNEHPMREHIAADFARELADKLQAGREARYFDALVLVAEPHLLGLLRAALDRATAALVSDTFTKDLVHVADADLPAHLEPLFAV